MMKDRFNRSNLPLSVFDDFHNIEINEVKEALLRLINLMYDDYTIEEVKEMFSTFSSTAYEIYRLFRQCDKNASAEYKQTLDMIVEVILFCSSQITSYEVINPFKLLPRRG